MSTRAIVFWIGILGFVIGIVIASFAPPPLNRVFVSLISALIILTVSALFRWRTLGFFSFFLIAVVLGALRLDSFKTHTATRIPVTENLVTIRGEVDAVEKREKGNRALVAIDSVDDVNVAESVRVFVYYDGAPTIVPADTVAFRGVLEIPSSFETPQGRTFDYDAYLQARNIGHVMYQAEYISKTNGNRFAPKRLVHVFRTSLLRIFEEQLDTREAALVSGITLGARSSIDAKLTDALIATGTIHIVALSGYNVTLVSNTVYALLARIFRKRRALIAGMISIILFVMVAGGGSPAVRAGIMAVLALLATYFGSSYSIDRALGTSFTLMLVSNPLLLFDISFQLSFLATIGVIYVSPGIERWLAFLPQWTRLHEPLSLTLGAQVFVLPILIYSSGVLSFTSVPVNIIIGPLVPLVMIFGFMAMILSVFGSIIAMPMVFLSGISAWLIIWLVFLFAKIPFGAITISAVHPIVLAAVYVLIVGIVFKKRIKNAFK